MGASLYLVSLKEGAGKTALAAALLSNWRGNFPVAYASDNSPDGDFISRSLGIDVLPLSQLKEAISCYKLVLVEALSTEIAIEGWVLLIAFYPEDELGEVLRVAEGFGGRLLGLVLNAVPKNRLKDNPWQRALKDWKPHKKDKLPLLGLLPQERGLLSPTVAEIAQALGGRFTLSFPQRLEEVVEHFMVGVYCLDPVTLYFGLRKNKAVIFRGDRPDMHLGALETELKLMILTEGIEPHPYVRHQAEIKKVPIMVVPDNTLTVMAKLERLTEGLKFRQASKIDKMSKLIRENFLLGPLEKALL